MIPSAARDGMAGTPMAESCGRRTSPAPAPFEARGSSLDGTEIWTEVLSAPLQDAVGRVSGAIMVVIDVDRPKWSEEAVQTSKERLRQFGVASLDVFWIRGAETLQWTYLTLTSETIYRPTQEEALTGDNYRGWQDLIVPEDLA